MSRKKKPTPAEKIEQRLQVLGDALENAKANLCAIRGGIAELERLKAQLEKKEE